MNGDQWNEARFQPVMTARIITVADWNILILGAVTGIGAIFCLTAVLVIAKEAWLHNRMTTKQFLAMVIFVISCPLCGIFVK